MSIESSSRGAQLTCPLCRGPVAIGSAGCRPCHLPMADVVRHSSGRGHRRSAMSSIGLRVAGLVLYSAVVAWSWWQLPQTLPFVVPAAVLGGGVLHVLKGRPWWGLLVFGLVVVVVPVLLWPALGTGTYSDLTEVFSRD